MTDLERLVDTVTVWLADKTTPPTEDQLRNLVRAMSAMPDIAPLSDKDLESAVRLLETRFSIRMAAGTIFEAEDYKPWLVEKQASIEWYYWKRYRKYLLQKGFPPNVVSTMDMVADKVLDHLEDPTKTGKWARKGLVVGHVQSGKTANYTGLICKASDAGYKVIIVLAGVLNSLRNQTQKRIESDFIGWSTQDKKSTGVGSLSHERRPVCFTTSEEDFNRQTANAIAMDLQAIKEPVVLVVKKNKATLENLYAWLRDNNRYELHNSPMLLIDDEADHASINTNAADTDPTAINQAIRNLLSLFTTSAFVGYTATPFANIFIDPENADEMENGELYKDLFPRDFILSLDPPDNYVGPQKLFLDDSTLNCIRDISDNDETFPTGHKIDFEPECMPDSLRHAIHCFFIATTIRILKGDRGKCHSMMVNISRFTRVQNIMANLIRDEVKQLKHSIFNYAGLPPEKAVQNRDLAMLKKVFESEFSETDFQWLDVQGKLRESSNPIEVLAVNSSSADTLDYSPSKYPEGRRLIVVGGMGLSRGLTIEGLNTSYFLRNSIMYDTLMQMGRWFGYRDGYADICRIFMTQAASSWYAHIADATEELRHDFKTMEKASLTPKDFGLRVRSHPTALIVTARNKMRTGRRVPMQIALEGRLAATSVLCGDRASLEHNRRVLEAVCSQAERQVTGQFDQSIGGYLWKSVSPSTITTAIQAFINHPECLLTYSEPLCKHIDWMTSSYGLKFDILLRSSEDGERDYMVESFKISPVERAPSQLSSSRIEFNKRRLGSRGDEKAGLTREQIAEVKGKFQGKNPPDRSYRAVEGRNPLFIVYFVRLKETDRIVPAYGISFPGDSGSARLPQNLVEYVVNTTWWKKNYNLADEEDED